MATVQETEAEYAATIDQHDSAINEADRLVRAIVAVADQLRGKNWRTAEFCTHGMPTFSSEATAIDFRAWPSHETVQETFRRCHETKLKAHALYSQLPYSSGRATPPL